MARGEHPMRTPVYGMARIVVAMLLAVAVTYGIHPAAPLRAAVLVVCLAMALIGTAMTLRDYSGPPRP